MASLPSAARRSAAKLRITPRELTALLALTPALASVPTPAPWTSRRPSTAARRPLGPTDPQLTGPFSPGARDARINLPCSPCLQRRCPFIHHNCFDEPLEDFKEYME